MTDRRRVLAVVVDAEGRVERFMTRQELEALLNRRRSARLAVAWLVLAVAFLGVLLIALGAE